MPELLGFTGDLFLGDRRRMTPFACFLQELGTGVDLVINFEGTLHTDHATLQPARQKILLTSPATLLEELDGFPVVMAGVNNNHINDFGDRVAQETIDLLSARFPTFGAGYAGDEFHTAIRDIGGCPVGFAAYCTADTSPLFCSSHRIGPREMTESQVRDDLRRLKARADQCVAIAHWGYEDYHYPHPAQVQSGRKLIDLGFSLVIGSHSHSVQGCEAYGGGLIFYSLGNFSFPDYHIMLGKRRYELRWMRRSLWGIIPLFSVHKGRLALKEILYTVQTREGSPRLAASGLLRRRFDHYCRALKVPDYHAWYKRRERLEAVQVRIEEFAVRRNRLAAIGTKCMGLLGLARERKNEVDQ